MFNSTTSDLPIKSYLKYSPSFLYRPFLPLNKKHLFTYCILYILYVQRTCILHVCMYMQYVWYFYNNLIGVCRFYLAYFWIDSKSVESPRTTLGCIMFNRIWNLSHAKFEIPAAGLKTNKYIYRIIIKNYKIWLFFFHYKVPCVPQKKSSLCGYFPQCCTIFYEWSWIILEKAWSYYR